MKTHTMLQLLFHLLVTMLFIYIFYQLLSMKKSNNVYYIWSEYVLNKYCFICYLLLSIYIFTLDSYIGLLLLILAIASFRIANKEYFDVTTSLTTIPNVTTIPNGLVQEQELGIDARFKVDDVAVRDILRQIKSQVDFDPYKSNLDKQVIYEIYNKYFDNDIFLKLKNNNDDSASYLAAGNFNYIPSTPKVDYDIVTYQNLNDNIQFGINPIIDGITNKTKINRGS